MRGEAVRDDEGYVRVLLAADVEPGEGRIVEAGGWWIALFNVGGQFYAIENACSHMAGPLGSGRLEGFVVRCPIHGWPFDIRTGCSPTNEHQRVGRFDVRADEDWVWVRALPKSAL